MAQERRSADTREKILAVAEAQFAEKGYAGAHLQDMAEAVGVQKTALYYYFPSKGALYLAVLSRMLEEFDHRIGAVLSLDLPHRERLERLLDDFNDLLAERRNYSLILLRIFVDRVPVDLRPLQPTIEKTVGSILSFYRAGVESGDLRKASSRHFFQNFLGLALFHYAGAEFSKRVLGLDIFTPTAVAWRRDEVRNFVTHGVAPVAAEDDP
ncbi:MAG: TetR/AcrR family transcriptional regulator [Proteobacteria bacterium]|nr:TetR/AcrR family transcriptional regulator [Pseudomonadota bacterium]